MSARQVISLWVLLVLAFAYVGLAIFTLGRHF
jgi:hypothetical protein